jgi:hypothetical protein
MPAQFIRPQMREESAMKRSAGVTVIAILSLIGSAFALLMGVLIALSGLLASASNPSEFPGSPVFLKAMLVVIALFYALLAAWGIATAIGLFRLKKWARISIIIFSSLLSLMSACGLVGGLAITFLPNPNQAMDPAILTIVRIFMACFSLAQLSLGIWWLVFFTRKKVKEQFEPAMAAPTVLSAPQAFPPALDAPIVASLPSSTGRPLSFTILAWLMLASCVFIPLNLLLRFPAILFTMILTGWAAAVYYLAFLALHLYIGIGLLRLRLMARIVAIGYYCFVFLNAAAFYLAPGARLRMLDLIHRFDSMFPWKQPWQNQQPFLFDTTPFMIMGACMGLVMLLIPLYFLITRKAAFEKAAAAGGPLRFN